MRNQSSQMKIRTPFMGPDCNDRERFVRDAVRVYEEWHRRRHFAGADVGFEAVAREFAETSYLGDPSDLIPGVSIGNDLNAPINT